MFVIPKLRYLLPCFLSDRLEKYDSVLCSIVSSITLAQNEEALIQATLPVKLGGLGVSRWFPLLLPQTLCLPFSPQVTSHYLFPPLMFPALSGCMVIAFFLPQVRMLSRKRTVMVSAVQLLLQLFWIELEMR